jgi:hypothetical protein
MISEPSQDRRLASLFLALLCLWLGVLVFRVNHTLADLQKERSGDAPFGIFISEDGSTYAQDFSYNMLYFEGIRQHLVARPYRMEDQEKLMRRILPTSQSGMTHAYSPVAFVLAQPLLWFSGQGCFLVYTLIGAISIAALFAGVLLPQVKAPGQLAGLGVCAMSVCLYLTFELGQSSLITTSLLGFFWALLRYRNAEERSGGIDFALALLFWALCLKPSIAILPLMLLLGARAWRPLGLGALLLLVTWGFTANYYGGWWTGLGDYSHLLNHYNGEEMTSFMQRLDVAPTQTYWERLDPHLSLHLFLAQRNLILISSALFLLLRWTGRMSGSAHFQAMIGAFLLFSPYLLPSEDWILCLLVVEGPFFATGRSGVPWAKLLVLAGIMDLRGGVTFPIDLNYQLRVVLFAWMLIASAWERREGDFDERSPLGRMRVKA